LWTVSDLNCEGEKETMLLDKDAKLPGEKLDEEMRRDEGMQRPDPVTAASWFVRDYYPAALGAMLSGSQARGEGHNSSDLDLVILNSVGQPHWATFEAYDWPIEAFVMTPASYAHMFAVEVEHRWPIYLRMSAESLILFDLDGQTALMQQTAQQLMAAGPLPLNAEEVAQTRYHLTSVMADMADIDDTDELRILAHDLVDSLIDACLGYSRHWLGKGKWRWRYLRDCDPLAATRLSRAMTAFYQHNDKEPLLKFARGVLSLFGGPLFAGRFTAY